MSNSCSVTGERVVTQPFWHANEANMRYIWVIGQACSVKMAVY